MCSGGWADDATYPCSGLQTADVAVSSDNMSPDRDHHSHGGYSAGGTFNTGLLLVRATPIGRQFVDMWHKLVVDPPRGEFSSLTSDQQVFNHMMRMPNQWPGVSARDGAWLMKHREMLPGLQLGALPLTLFINGHGYFVQSANIRLGVPPIAVHATYSLDNHDAVAKKQRFREAGLWDIDPPAYYDGKYLALNYSMSPRVQAAVDKCAAHRADSRGDGPLPPTLASTPHASVIDLTKTKLPLCGARACLRVRYVTRREPPTNIDVHAQSLASYIAELRDALALAKSLGRTLILPRWACYCDRLWSGSDDIFHFGCMYPGAQEGKFVPFTCPMDHVLSPAQWKGEPYRDAAFLERNQHGRAQSVADIRLLPRAAFDALPPAAQRGALPLGTTDAEVQTLLGTHGLDTASVLRLPHARGLLCGLSSRDATSNFNGVSGRLLRVPQWCAKCFQPCKQELAKWLGPDVKSAGGWGMGGGNFYCLDVPAPPAFRHGECVLNVAST